MDNNNTLVNTNLVGSITNLNVTDPTARLDNDSYGAPVNRGPTATWTPTETGQQSHKTTVTIDELLEREQALGGPQDRDSVLDALDGILPDIHRNGSELHANCPSCGHTRNPNAKNKSDRFFSTKRTNYQFWTCRQCEYRTTTSALLGIAPGTIPQRPIVKSWNEQPHDAQKIEWTRAAYASLSEFSQRYSDLITDYLEGRGVSSEVAKNQGLGYIDKSLYLAWYRGLTPDLKAGVEFGGLPEVKECGTKLGAGWAMVSGYKGKIVFPYRDQDGNVCDIRTRSISDKDTTYGKSIRYMGPRGSYEERGAQLPYMPTGDHTTIILTEGEFKSLVPLSKNCIHPIYGLRGTSEPLEPMLDYFNNKTVILAFDNDDAGRMATVRQGRALRAKGISVLILDPAQLTPHKAIDDFINAEGIEVFNKLLEPANLLTLPEFEQTFDEETRDRFICPKADIGTVRRWTPAANVDQFAHPTVDDSLTLDETTDQIKAAVKAKIQGWQKGNGQLLIGSPAGVGKTTATMETVAEIIETEHGTVSVFLPNHAQIDEKIADGTLAEFQHIYGRRWDKEDGIKNCQQAETASTLTQLGYNVASTICPSCEHLDWCRQEGYKAQFKGKANRAYVHAHLFTDYPSGSNIAIIDEATHKTFIQDTKIYSGNLQRALSEDISNQAERELMESLLMLFTMPNIETLTGIEFYAVLQRQYPELITSIDKWGNGSAVQNALFEMVVSCTQSDDRNVYEIEHLPPAFGQALFAVLNEDVRLLAQGKQPTGRIKLVNAGSHKYIEIVSSRELPGWYYETPTILLNATANETISSELWGIEGQLDVVSPNVAVMEGNEILQDITLNNAKSGLVGDGEIAQRQRAAWLDRIRDHIGNHDPSDVVLVTVKPLSPYLIEAFPLARVAWYGALEGRNDLQAGITILCNPPSINLPAIQDEARALWPGIDCTLRRKSISHDNIQNDENQYLSIEQIDAVDPRLSALIDQHRDALAIQAIGRARLVRNSDRRVVVMFSRPIPGTAPTEVIYSREQKGEYRKNKTLERLIAAAGAMLESNNSFSVSTLAETAKSVQRTVHKYWGEIVKAMGVQWVEIPCLQPLANGGRQSVTVRLAVNIEGRQILKKMIDNARINGRSQHYNNTIIANGSTVDLAIPDNFVIDIETLYPSPKSDIPEPPPANIEKEEAAQPVTPAVPVAVEPVAKYRQVARNTFPCVESAQKFAAMMRRGGVFDVAISGCTVDRRHKSGFDISHLVDEYTKIVEVVKHDIALHIDREVKKTKRL